MMKNRLTSRFLWVQKKDDVKKDLFCSSIKTLLSLDRDYETIDEDFQKNGLLSVAYSLLDSGLTLNVPEHFKQLIGIRVAALFSKHHANLMKLLPGSRPICEKLLKETKIGESHIVESHTKDAAFYEKSGHIELPEIFKRKSWWATSQFCDFESSLPVVCVVVTDADS